MPGRELRHILQSQQFDPDFIDLIFQLTRSLKSKPMSAPEFKLLRLDEHYLSLLFYEPSTRTRKSFDFAGQRLGMRVVSTENARDFSSAVKGETLEDTIRVLCEYGPAAIVLRHYETGAAERAAAVSSVPIINAGDGKGQHPTQALLDLFTIQEKLGVTDGIHIVMVGDLLNGRTVRSLVYLLTKFTKYRDVRFTFVSPSNLRMGRDIIEWLESKEVNFTESDKLYPATLGCADVVYCTRIQKERGSDVPEEILTKFRIGKPQMDMMQKHTLLMHPLPRNNEILPEVDDDPRAVYFEQAGNGMYIRMALLPWVLRII